MVNICVSPFVTHIVAYLNLRCLLGMLNSKSNVLGVRDIMLIVLFKYDMTKKAELKYKGCVCHVVDHIAMMGFFGWNYCAVPYSLLGLCGCLF